MKSLLPFLMIIIAVNVFSQNNVAIIPEPASFILKEGQFSLSSKTNIISDSKTRLSANYLSTYLSEYYSIKPEIVMQSSKSANTIELICDDAEKNLSKYQMDISKNKITLKGSPQGIFYGIQTLIQLMPADKKKLRIQMAQIIDSARFGYRGMHLDEGRHFFGAEFVKKYIDYLALHKFNTLHWHLTEDQGWRIEIKKYPNLTQTGSCRSRTLEGPYGSGRYDDKPYCGFYTQEAIREIVKYASDRYITIIPEIEMPGHSMAALTSYPYLGCTKGPYHVADTWGVFEDVLCAGNDSTFNFLQDVLDEVMQLFPSPIIHIGGDECPKKRWHACSLCQQRMKDNQLADEHELQSYFIKRIGKYVNSKGRNIMGWDEILEGGLAPNAVVMSWRGEDGGITAAKSGHDAVMCPGTPVYFDHSQSNNEDSLTNGGFNSLKMVYEYEPVPAILKPDESKHILGAQANMWTEYMSNKEKVEYMLFPRMSSLSEVLWSPKEKRSWKLFESKIPVLFEKYDLWKTHYSRAIYDIKATIISNNNKGIKWQLSTDYPNSSIFIKNGSENRIYDTAITISSSGIYNAVVKDVSGKDISPKLTENFHINKATGRKIEIAIPPSNSYQGSGILTLVDGIQNSTGMAKKTEFLGFSGSDLNVTLDLGVIQDIDSVKVHAFEQQSSWIHRPSSVSIFGSKNGIDFELLYVTSVAKGLSNLVYTMTRKTEARFLKIIAQNAGTIPVGMPGAGYKAWLFADEIEVF